LVARFAFCIALAAGVAGCGPDYSPNTYASNAVQQANKVDQGVVVGVRQVDVSASGTVGTVTGAAAGGIAGAQVASGATSAFTALGGSLVGGIAGAAAEHATSDTTAFEYIVRKTNGDLLSVTQKDEVPLTIGQKVLVIAGNQARVVADYTVPVEAPKPAPVVTAPAPGPVAAAPLPPPENTDAPKVETGP
jgi:outer membrane lipoprotein SlyB